MLTGRDLALSTDNARPLGTIGPALLAGRTVEASADVGANDAEINKAESSMTGFARIVPPPPEFAANCYRYRIMTLRLGGFAHQPPKTWVDFAIHLTDCDGA